MFWFRRHLKQNCCAEFYRCSLWLPSSNWGYADSELCDPCLPSQKQLCICISALSMGALASQKPSGLPSFIGVGHDWQSLHPPFGSETTPCPLQPWSGRLHGAPPLSCAALGNDTVICHDRSSRSYCGPVACEEKWQHVLICECQSIDLSIPSFIPDAVKLSRSGTRRMEAMCQGKTTDAM